MYIYIYNTISIHTYIASFDYNSCMIGVSSARHLLNPKSGHSTGAVRQGGHGGLERKVARIEAVTNEEECA